MSWPFHVSSFIKILDKSFIFTKFIPFLFTWDLRMLHFNILCLLSQPWDVSSYQMFYFFNKSSEYLSSGETFSKRIRGRTWEDDWKNNINVLVSDDSQCLCGNSDSVMMSLFVLLLLVSGTQAGFYAGVISFIVKDIQGSLVQVRFHFYKFFFLCFKAWSNLTRFILIFSWTFTSDSPSVRVTSSILCTAVAIALDRQTCMKLRKALESGVRMSSSGTGNYLMLHIHIGEFIFMYKTIFFAV